MAKDIISAYRSVCRDLIGLEAYEPIARRTMEQAHSTVFKGKAPGGNTCYVPLDTALEAYDLAAAEFNETCKTIDQLRMTKLQIEQIIAKMSEPEQAVITLHIEQGMNLRQIAELSNYSYIHIRRIASQIRSKGNVDMTA